MRTLRTVADLRSALGPMRARGSVGFVPTMGALHEGHVALFRTARATCGAVVVSLFVNPTQFNDAADLAGYPRHEADDVRVADEAGVDVLFAPAADEMYPAGFSLRVEVDVAAAGLEGAHRPGHFHGVTTICLKLFTIVQPTDVFLGQKDAEQVVVLRRLVRDANLDLDDSGRAHGPGPRWPGALVAERRPFAGGAPTRLGDPGRVDRGRGGARAGRGRGGCRARRARRSPDRLRRGGDFDDHPTLVAAVTVGRTRLIDNVPLDEPGLAGLESSVAVGPIDARSRHA